MGVLACGGGGPSSGLVKRKRQQKPADPPEPVAAAPKRQKAQVRVWAEDNIPGPAGEPYVAPHAQEVYSRVTAEGVAPVDDWHPEPAGGMLTTRTDIDPGSDSGSDPVHLPDI